MHTSVLSRRARSEPIEQHPGLRCADVAERAGQPRGFVLRQVAAVHERHEPAQPSRIADRAEDFDSDRARPQILRERTNPRRGIARCDVTGSSPRRRRTVRQRERKAKGSPRGVASTPPAAGTASWEIRVARRPARIRAAMGARILAVVDSHPSGFDIIALTGWAADRNESAMRGARALGRRFAERTGARLLEVGEPGPAQDLAWPEALDRARPHLRSVARAISDVVQRGQPALIFANRCAASIATIAAGLGSTPDLAVLYLDAQADFNTPQTTMSGYLGGMVISALCGLWDTGFGAGLEPNRLVLAGSRDIDPGERELLARHEVGVYEVGNPGPIVERLRDRSVWIHVDLDVLEPGLVPTEYRVPGGPGLDQLRDLLDVVARTNHIVALEIAEYELDPEQADVHATRIEQLIEPVLQRWPGGAERSMR